MASRSEQLRHTIAAFLDEHKRWQGDPNRKTPDGPYASAVDDLRAVYESGSIPVECNPLCKPIENLLAEWDAFQDAEQSEPHHTLWLAVKQLGQALAPIANPPMRHRESIETLHGQDVPHWQIAKIWGIVDERGQPLQGLIAQLLKDPDALHRPGFLLGRDWVDPDAARRLKEEAAANEAYANVEAKSAKQKKNRKPCPESPEQLYLQEVPKPQAAAMLCVDEAEVDRLWAELDLKFGVGQDVEDEAAGEVPSKGKRGKKGEAVAP